MDKLSLRAEWRCLMGSANVDIKQSEDLFANVIAAYSEPHRHYHTHNHLRHMFSELRAANIDTTSAYWATWYHDIIYNPGDSRNEQKSAEVAKANMELLGIASGQIDQVTEIILATKTHLVRESQDNVLAHVLDADMAILGASPERYREYQAGVEAEFAAIPKLMYRTGRKKFLKALLKLPRIYSTGWFFGQYEKSARNNIKQELSGASCTSKYSFL